MKKSLLLALVLARVSRGVFTPSVKGKRADVTTLDYVEIVEGCELNPGYRFAAADELEEFHRKYHVGFPLLTFGKNGGRYLKIGFNPAFLHGQPEEQAFYAVGNDGKATQKIISDLTPYGMVLHFLTMKE